MKSIKKFFLRSFACAFFVLTIASLSICAADRTQADRRDERNEDARVKAAKKELDQRKSAFSKDAKEYKSASSTVADADRALLVAKKHYDAQRDLAEQNLEGKTGIPASLKAIHELAAEIKSLSEKIETETRLTGDWLAATKLADEAKIRLQKLLDEPGEAEAASEDSEDVESLEKVINHPRDLELQAVNTDSKVMRLRSQLESLQAHHAELQKKIPDSLVNRQPKVLDAKKKLDDAKSKAQAALALLQKKKSAMAISNQSVLQAQKRLTQAIQADQRDKNESPKPKNKKNN